LAPAIASGTFPSGIGLGINAIMKFKAHEQKWSQVHIGAIFIAAALILVPVIFTFRNGTLVGSETSVLGTGGVPAFEIPP
jgi:hypothetical protein